MAAFVKQWQRAVGFLSKAANSPCDELYSDNKARCFDIIARTTDNNSSPNMAKKMVQAKVPLTGWRVCRQLIATHEENRTKLGVGVAIMLAGLWPGLDAAGNGACNSGSSSGSVAAQLRQQLSQSGLLTVLPGVVTDAAAQLRTLAAAEEAAADEQCLFAKDVLFLLSILSQVWPDCLTSTAHGALPLADLVSATLAYLSSRIKAGLAGGAQGGFEPSAAEKDCLRYCSDIAQAVGAEVSAVVQQKYTYTAPPPELQARATQAMHHPSFVQLLAFRTGVFLLVPRMLQASGAAGSSSNSNSGNSSSQAAAAAANSSTAFQRQQQQQQQLQDSTSGNAAWLPAQVAAADVKLPQRPVIRLLQQLDCCPELALWAASRYRCSGRNTEVTHTDIIMELVICFQRYARHYVTGDNESAADGLPSAPAQLLGWLAAALLKWAADTPSSSSEWVLRCYFGCRAGLSALSCMSEMQQRPASSLKRMMRLVLQLLPALLAAWRTQLQEAAATGAGGSDSSNSSSGAGKGADTSQDLPTLPEAVSIAAVLLQGLLCESIKARPRPQLSEAVASQVFAVFEELVRAGLLAAAPHGRSASSSSSSSSEEWCAALTDLHSYIQREESDDECSDEEEEGEEGLSLTALLSLLLDRRETAAAAAAAAVGGAAAAGDSHSPHVVQQQLFGLLLSMLKINSTSPSNTLSSMELDNEDVPLGVVWCRVVMTAATTMLSRVTQAVDTSAAGSAAPAPPTAAIHGLPWAVLLGRCFLQLSAFLKAPQQEEGDAAATTAPSAAAQQHLQVVSDLKGVVADAAAAVARWLRDDSTIEQLTALGYGHHRERLCSELAAVIAQAGGAEAAVATAARLQIYVSAAAISSYSAQLQAVGRSLTAFATPLACNNPSCGNVAGPAEAELVGGRSCICGGCLVARYCSRSCQSQHWKHQHKPVCKALAAAAAAVKAEAGASTSMAGAVEQAST